MNFFSSQTVQCRNLHIIYALPHREFKILLAIHIELIDVSHMIVGKIQYRARTYIFIFFFPKEIFMLTKAY